MRERREIEQRERQRAPGQRPAAVQQVRSRQSVPALHDERVRGHRGGGAPGRSRPAPAGRWRRAGQRDRPASPASSGSRDRGECAAGRATKAYAPWPSTEPAMKAPSVIAMRTLPAPAPRERAGGATAAELHADTEEKGADVQPILPSGASAPAQDLAKGAAARQQRQRRRCWPAASIRSWALTPTPRRSTRNRRVEARRSRTARGAEPSPASPPTTSSAASLPSTAMRERERAGRRPIRRHTTATAVCGRARRNGRLPLCEAGAHTIDYWGRASAHAPITLT